MMVPPKTWFLVRKCSGLVSWVTFALCGNYVLMARPLRVETGDQVLRPHILITEVREKDG
jgi:hypothetical protein